jgi:hypothetical protein
VKQSARPWHVKSRHHPQAKACVASDASFKQDGKFAWVITKACLDREARDGVRDLVRLSHISLLTREEPEALFPYSRYAYVDRESELGGVHRG